MTETGRRARNRATRHKQLIDAASAIVLEKGLDGLTMQDVADRVDCAVGTIYTYFTSKSALLAALQSDAIRVLADSHDRGAAMWDEGLESAEVEAEAAAIARMIGLARLIIAWPELHPREFDFLQMLIGNREKVIAPDDARTVIPQALMLFAEGRVLIDGAVQVGAIDHDPDRPGDDSLARVVRWISGIEGAVLVSDAAALVADIDPDAFDLRRITERLTSELLTAWGASQQHLDAAFGTVDDLEARGLLLPPP